MIDVRRLGLVSYAEGLELQRALVDDRKAGRIPNTLLLLQHPHVLTIGVKKDGRQHILAPAEVLAERGVEVFETGRGGDVTYHGPGQLVGYPILNLDPDRRDVHKYVRDLEEVMMRVCAEYGLAAERVKGMSGAWVGDAKIGAIGVRISRWVTSHGFAFNVTTDLDFFNLIVPLRDCRQGCHLIGLAAGPADPHGRGRRRVYPPFYWRFRTLARLTPARE